MKIKFLQIKEAQGEYITAPNIILDVMKEEAFADRESFWVLHLNTKNKIIEKELAAIGTLNGCTIHPREVFRKAVINSTNCIITVHNHPSGSSEPSELDFEVWKRLKEAGDILGIPVLDNIIIAHNSYYSQENFPHIINK